MTVSPENFISELNEKRSRFIETARENDAEAGLRKLMAELYPDQAHFVYELLQNAEDAKATYVRFELSGQELRFAHNGARQFNHKDVESITGIGTSTKKDDVNKIGKFGVGFKAVFSYCDTPEIHSGDYSFKIEHLFCPIQITPVSRKDSETLFVFPLGSSEKTPEQCSEEILKVFSRLDHSAVLFLNSIKSIKWEVQGRGKGRVFREHPSEVHQELARIEVTNPLAGIKSERAWFMVYQKPLDGHGDLNCAIAYELKCRSSKMTELLPDVDIARQMKVVETDGKLCIFFPAEKESTGLKFHLNGPFASSVDRASIKHDDEGNVGIIETMVDLLLESMFSLKDIGLLNIEFLNVIPNSEDNIPAFFERFRTASHKHFRNKRLLERKSGGFVKAKQAVKGLKELSDHIDDSDIRVLLDSEKSAWVAGVLQNSRADKLLDDLNVTTFNRQAFVDSVETNFSYYDQDDEEVDEAEEWLLAKDPSWIQKFYLLLNTAAKRTDSEYRLDSMRIVLTDAESLEYGFELYLPNPDALNVAPSDFVSSAIFEGLGKKPNERILEFLGHCNVEEYGDQDEVMSVLDEFYSEGEGSVEAQLNVEHMKRFVGFVADGGSFRIFKERTIFLTQDNKYLVAAESVHLDLPFTPTGLNEVYRSDDQEVASYPLSEDYLNVEGFAEFARKLGVRDGLKIETCDLWNNPHVNELRKGMRSARETHRGVREDYTIDGIKSLLANPNLAIASIVVRTMNGVDPRVLNAKYRPNAQYSTRYADSNLVCVLKDAAWIPSKDGRWLTAKEIDPGEIHDDLQLNDDNGWMSAVGFGSLEKENRAKVGAKETAAKILGCSYEEIELINTLRTDPELYEEFLSLAHRQAYDPEFPENEVKNPDRRRSKVEESIADSDRVGYEERTRSVRTSAGSKEASTYLRSLYTNEDEEQVCQLCHDIMPFKKRNGNFYFDSVEIARGMKRERNEAHIGLCPTCAAKYKEFVKRDTKASENLLEDILDSEGTTVLVELGDDTAELKFVDTHIHDLKVLLHETEEG
ncbi:hypothetical protein GPB2148_1466 [marine gamma proteobacterium HTCC2148]|nr:hypothetical protein GPB2148_1466 [marine gamma proteobacterium HTCC2148]